jgi:hypothetical protein
VVVRELVLYLNEILVRVQDELLQPCLQVLQIGVVLKGKLHHPSGVVNLLVLVEDVKSL